MESNERKPRKSVEWNYILYMFRTLLGMIYPVITFSYTSQVLGVETIGNFNYARSFSQFFVLVSLLGVGRYGNREGAKVREDREAYSRLAHEIFLISFIVSLLVAAVYGICAMLVPGLAGYRQLLFIFSFSILFNTQAGMEWVYTSNEDFTYITVRAVLFQIFGVVAMFLFVKLPADLWKYAVIYVCATNGPALFNYIHAHKYVTFRWLGNYHPLRHVKSLMYLMAVNISISIYSELDTFMLGMLSNDYAVGIYTAAVKLNRMVNSMISCFGTVAMPRLSYYCEKGEEDKFQNLINKGFHIVFLLSVPICVGMFALSSEFILLLSGTEFLSAGRTAKIMTPIILFIPFSSLAKEQVLIPMKKETTVLFISLFGAAVNVATNSLLIPIFNENGAAVATLFAEGSVAVVSVLCTKKTINFPKVFAGYWKYWLAAAPIFLIRYISALFISSVLWLSAVTIVCSCLCYFLILWLFRDALVREGVERIFARIGRK